MLFPLFSTPLSLLAQEENILESSSLTNDIEIFKLPDTLYMPDSIYNQSSLLQDLWLQLLSPNTHELVDNSRQAADSIYLPDSIYALEQIIAPLFPSKRRDLATLADDSVVMQNFRAFGLPDSLRISEPVMHSRELYELLFRSSGNLSLSLLKPVLFNQQKTLPNDVTLDQIYYSPTDLALEILDLQIDKDLNDKIKKSGKAAKIKNNYLEALVDRKADSIDLDMTNRKGYLYWNAVLVYGDITLEAAYIEIDFAHSEVFATGLPDTTGRVIGTPVFSQSGDIYEAEEMRYNFETKKGLIYSVITQDGEGYMHGSKVKKLDDGSLSAESGSFTTCDLKHPHFEFKFKKAKVIPNDKIITGPAYLAIADVPTPLFIPFGIFPNSTTRHSGIIIPSWGQSATYGYSLEGGGYYWAISDHMDLEVTGDIYTRGSWAIDPKMRYTKRYKYNGSMAFGYGKNIQGIEGTSSYSDARDFKIVWTHAQDPKANPNSTFSANVNIYSQDYNSFNPTTTNNYLSNTFSSSIAYQRNWGSSLFFTATASHSQNNQNHNVNLVLPTISLSTAKWYPFRKKIRKGELKWYEDINLKYSNNAKNELTGLDTTIFEGNVASRLEYGMKQTVPISLSLKALKYFNWTNSISYNEYWYGKTVNEQYIGDPSDTSEFYGVVVDTLNGFSTARDFSFTTSLSTKMYGMFVLKGGPLKAVRHVLTPAIDFSYKPDFSDPSWGFYNNYYNPETEKIVTYSRFRNGVYGGPSRGLQESVGFSLSNNLEMKVRSAADTVTGTKKIKLIDQFKISMSHNFAADSLRWSNLTLYGTTKLFEKLNITYGSSWTPYIKNENNQKINKTVWDAYGRLFDKNSANWTLSMNYRLDNKTFQKESKEGEKEKQEEAAETPYGDRSIYDPEADINWDIPWQISLNYSFNYTDENIYVYNSYVSEKRIVQTLGFNGNFSLTKNWKVTFNSGYDFEQKKLSYTSINIIRDLHCWQMSFNWVPFGYRQMWNFKINVKASMFQDLKYEKKRDYRDYY